MEINIQEIFEKHGILLGKNKMEVYKLAIKEIVEAVLLEASNSAEIVELKISDGFVYNTVTKVDKDSIKSVINKVKF